MPSVYLSRYQKLISRFDEQKIDVLLISNPYNIRYLTGLDLSNAELVISPFACALFIDARYSLIAQQSSYDFSVEVIQFKHKEEEVVCWIKDHGFHNLGLEAHYISYKAFIKWQEKVSGQVIPCENLVEHIRLRKDESEISCLKKAIKVVERTNDRIPNILMNSLGESERQISVEIDYLLKKEGAERLSFDLIVAIGDRSAMPHAIPSSQKLRSGDLILVDMGAVYSGYCSDVTRLFVLDERRVEIVDIFQILKEAQAAATDKVKPGVLAKEIDSAARSVIEKAGYGSYFGHGTGHGVGLEIHELPRIAPNSEVVIDEGMVFTIEPGIYLPGRFGLRLEDMVLVTKEGAELLTQSIPQEIMWTACELS